MARFRLNQTLVALPPSGIRKFFELVAEVPDVISLSIGEPDFVTPWHIREAAIYALESGNTHYTGNRGTPELRAEIAHYLTRKFQITYDPKTEILVTFGGSEAFDLVVRAVLNPGDEVLIPSPAYVMYGPLTTLAGGKVVSIPTSARTGWKFGARDLEKLITPKSKLLILNYPANPTGATFTRAELLKLAEVAERHDLLVVSDEIYAELTYRGTHTSFASLRGMQARTLTINGFSKAFAMTGFRLGCLAGPEEIINAANKIHQYSALCASSLAQAAAVEALRHGDVEVQKMKAEYELRRDFLVREFNRIGLPTETPPGAFYLFPDVSRTRLTGEEFALRLLEKEKVAVVPGTAFDGTLTKHVRVSYATGFAELEKAVERIERFVRGLKK